MCTGGYRYCRGCESMALRKYVKELPVSLWTRRIASLRGVKAIFCPILYIGIYVVHYVFVGLLVANDVFVKSGLPDRLGRDSSRPNGPCDSGFECSYNRRKSAVVMVVVYRLTMLRWFQATMFLVSGRSLIRRGREESRPYGDDDMYMIWHYYMIPYLYILIKLGNAFDVFFYNIAYRGREESRPYDFSECASFFV